MIKRIKYRLYGPDDKKVHTVIRYLDYKNFISTLARMEYKGEPMKGPIKLNLTFYMPIPQSWSKVKQRDADGQWHDVRPDRDNLEKGVCDALNKIVWKDDGQVCLGMTEKYYSSKPRIEIEVEQVS
jgi:Holliday junction resolvase RusA-like endonuclease